MVIRSGKTQAGSRSISVNREFHKSLGARLQKYSQEMLTLLPSHEVKSNDTDHSPVLGANRQLREGFIQGNIELVGQTGGSDPAERVRVLEEDYIAAMGSTPDHGPDHHLSFVKPSSNSLSRAIYRQHLPHLPLTPHSPCLPNQGPTPGARKCQVWADSGQLRAPVRKSQGKIGRICAFPEFSGWSELPKKNP